MASKGIACISGLILCLLSAPGAASDWVDIEDPKELRSIYSNKTFRGKDGRGDVFVAHFRADGTGILIQGSERIPRTWTVKGNDQVCVTAAPGTNCFRFQRHKTNRNEIVGQHVVNRWIFQATIEEGVPAF